jgi:ABC-type polysaccharide/polyol phosphate export permease
VSIWLPAGRSSAAATAWEDLAGGLRRSALWGRIGWLEIKRRYRRTVLGPFWNSVSLAVYTTTIGILGAGLWHQDLRQYLPFLATGMIVWTLVSTIVIESCQMFVTGHALFRHVRFEYSVLAYALVWRNLIVFLHNVLIYLTGALLFGLDFVGLHLLAAIPGLALVLVNAVWIALLVGMACLRFRDLQPFVAMVIQILMLATPIFWSPETLAGLHRVVFVQTNPVFHVIDVVRAPLLGQIPAIASYVVVAGMAFVGWSITFMLFAYFRKRISYWS